MELKITNVLTLGTVSIMFILSSVLYRCWMWGINADFSDQTSEDYIPLFRSNFPSLTGALLSKASPTGSLGAPVTYDQLMNDFNKNDSFFITCLCVFLLFAVGNIFI